MKLIQKQIIIFSGFIVFTLFGYFAFQNFNSSQSDEVTTITNTVAKDSVSQSGIETDTNKRLETVTNSGTNWGMSPFGSGKPLTEEENEKKPVFKKPNTEWKARTINSITYRLGEGNPTEVAVMDIKAYYNCTTPYEKRAMDQSGVISGCPETQYLTKEIEQALVKMLQSPLWEKVVTECRDTFQFSLNVDRFDAAFVTGNVLDLNTIISIGPDGRKKLNGLYDLASLLATEQRGGVTPSSAQMATPCYKNRDILSQMVENVGGTYNAGAMTQAE
jgi:hypothetical protein